jgi:hypothetical protein
VTAAEKELARRNLSQDEFSTTASGYNKIKL